MVGMKKCPDGWKRVVIRLEVEMITHMPGDTTPEKWFDYHCLGNEIAELGEQQAYWMDRNTCITCHRAKAVCLRNATPEDIEEHETYQIPEPR
jgi:hypothetical protein